MLCVRKLVPMGQKRSEQLRAISWKNHVSEKTNVELKPAKRMFCLLLIEAEATIEMPTIQMLEAAQTREGLSCIEKLFQKVPMLDVAKMAVRRATGTTSVVENCAVSLPFSSGLACLGTMEHESVHDPRIGHPATVAALLIDVGAGCAALASASDVSEKQCAACVV